jgi:hypothetical protein
MFRNPMAHGQYRNHPCICGSGKKMKKCHGKEYAITAEELEAIKTLGKEHNQRVHEFNQALIDKQEVILEKTDASDNETLPDAQVLAQESTEGSQGPL